MLTKDHQDMLECMGKTEKKAGITEELNAGESARDGMSARQRGEYEAGKDVR